MSDCRFGVSPVNYPDPDPDLLVLTMFGVIPFPFHSLKVDVITQRNKEITG